MIGASGPEGLRSGCGRMGPCVPESQGLWESEVHPPFGPRPEQMIGNMSRIQGKEMPERKTKTESSVGIDVSKTWLDVHVLPDDVSWRVPNTPEGSRTLKRRLKHLTVALVVVEATGKWHRAVHRSLHAEGFAVAVVDPYRVRNFAKANRILAKTDPLDARVLALFATVMGPQECPPAAQALEILQELVRARLSAVTELTSLKNQRAAAQSSFLGRHLERRIARLAKDIGSLEAEIARNIARDPALTQRWQILSSIPGIGPVSAPVLVACLPELGAASDKQIAALVGLAPIPDESGERRGRRRIRGGRQSVRNLLYLAALSASRHTPALRDFYQRLRDKGKEPKLALTAVARKLLVLANVLITDNRSWTPQPPKYA